MFPPDQAMTSINPGVASEALAWVGELAATLQG